MCRQCRQLQDIILAINMNNYKIEVSCYKFGHRRSKARINTFLCIIILNNTIKKLYKIYMRIWSNCKFQENIGPLLENLLKIVRSMGEFFLLFLYVAAFLLRFLLVAGLFDTFFSVWGAFFTM